MPFKHQDESYRIIKGIRFVAWSDTDAEYARECAKTLRKDGHTVRVVNIGGGMRRIFVKHPPVQLSPE